MFSRSSSVLCVPSRYSIGVDDKTRIGMIRPVIAEEEGKRKTERNKERKKKKTGKRKGKQESRNENTRMVVVRWPVLGLGG